MAKPMDYDLPMRGLDWLEYYSTHNVYHPGIDLNKDVGNQDCGNPVYAAKSGFIEYVWNSTWNSGGFGKFIIIHHDDGTYTRYAHLSEIKSTMRKGKKVKEGQLIGKVGNTGTKYCHLHFEAFNRDCAALQSRHWRAWRMYPSGWTKEKVQRYYLNPWKWLEEETSDGTPGWAKESVEWCKKEGIINNFEGGQMTDYEVSLVVKRLYDKLTK